VALIPASFRFSAFARARGQAFGVPAIAALGKEIGGRGFCPRLVQQTAFTGDDCPAAASGRVWQDLALLFADHNSDTRPAFALSCFTRMVIADSYVLGRLRVSGSRCILPAMISSLSSKRCLIESRHWWGEP
jgi:hypothetical protein